MYLATAAFCSFLSLCPAPSIVGQEAPHSPSPLTHVQALIGLGHAASCPKRPPHAPHVAWVTSRARPHRPLR